MTYIGAHAYVEGSAFLERRRVSNLTELLGIGQHSGLSDMMRMSGVDEAYVTGGASDYDKAEALFRVFSLWMGHPYVSAVQEVILRLTGHGFPLSIASLPEIWQAVAKSLMEIQPSVSDLSRLFGIDRMTCLLTPVQFEQMPQRDMVDGGISLCLHIPRAALDTLWEKSVTRQITPHNALNDATEGMTAYLDTLAARGCRGVAVNMAEEACFVKPNPYTPAQAMLRLQKGERLEERERSLVLFQTVRMLGGECLRRGWTMTLLDPQPQVSTALISYLHACHTLPALVTVSDVPTVDTMRSGDYMYPLPLCAHEASTAQKLRDLAARMPIGCLGGIYAPLHGVIDLPLWEGISKMSYRLFGEDPL